MLVRLRPVVHATPTATGLHVRGWASSFTIDGGAGLWTVWQRLAPQLAEGIPAVELTVPAGTPPAVAEAVELILAQLRAHDMVVQTPADWGADAPVPEIVNWLESVAADPLATWRRLRRVTVTITGRGALAAAAHRAARSAGLTTDAPVVADDGLLVAAGEHAVAAGSSSRVGYVVAPGATDSVGADARAVARRLGTDPTDGPPTEVLDALVGAAAVHRLCCAVGGLPDPSTESVVPAGEQPPEPVGQAVLVARLDPLRATYHPWLSTARPAPAPDDPSRTLDALTDPELGLVEPPQPGALVQVPANLAVSGETLGVGTTADAARLDAAIGALHTRLPARVIAGIDRTHALGSALRRAVRDFPGGAPVPEQEWAGDPTARRWWKSLTLRFAVPATIEVTRLTTGVVRAEIRSPQGLLAWAIEASASDAVAFAALAATGRAQAARGGTGHLNGAAPDAGHVNGVADEPPWVSREWHWPAGVRDSEAALQADLAALTGSAVAPASLGSALDSAGVVAFTVSTTDSVAVE